MSFNFTSIAFPISFEKIEIEDGEGIFRVTFLFLHIDFKYHLADI